ncbi:hypothetical protein F4810DRAFT_419434 [Camillea tinctor]|nr:hypothetical protein F4810DRAFT_419434 [Camillea tinctor]
MLITLSFSSRKGRLVRAHHHDCRVIISTPYYYYYCCLCCYFYYYFILRFFFIDGGSHNAVGITLEHPIKGQYGKWTFPTLAEACVHHVGEDKVFALLTPHWVGLLNTSWLSSSPLSLLAKVPVGNQHPSRAVDQSGLQCLQVSTGWIQPTVHRSSSSSSSSWRTEVQIQPLIANFVEQRATYLCPRSMLMSTYQSLRYNGPFFFFFFFIHVDEW